MPMGIKDIIETADMPTEMGSPLFAGWRSEKDAACVVGAAAGRRGHPRQDRDHRIRRHRAARHPQSRGTSNTRRAARRAARPRRSAAAWSAPALGTQVIGSTIRPASYCGAYGFKPTVNALNREGCHDYQSQSCTGIIARDAGGHLAGRARDRQRASAAMPARRASSAPHTCPAPAKPKRLAFLETAGWAERRARGARR